MDFEIEEGIDFKSIQVGPEGKIGTQDEASSTAFSSASVPLHSTSRTRMGCTCVSWQETWQTYKPLCWHRAERFPILAEKLGRVVSQGLSRVQGSRILFPNQSSRKTSISALLTMPKPLTVWITINCAKFWKRWEYQTTWPASWEICMQVRKQQLELDMEQQTGSK